ncbi:MAG: hypothetical protein K8I02_09045, partial [Candidatus Methylomirabilis sp.]|nr:hypothetical protein [Deltaproteobacteria bacterium]
LETCGGDPCAAARELAASGRGVTIHVVGFALGGAADDQLACIAEATGGSYLKPERGGDLREAFSKAVTVAAESGRLRFEFMGAGGLEPGLLAYVMDPKTSETVTSVKSGGERALSPGKYRISAEARPERITTEFTIVEGRTTLVRLGGTGSVGFRLLGPDGKEIDTFAYVQDPKSGDTVGTVEKGKTLEVSPGVYDLEVQTQPAPILRKGVRVEAGKRTIETVKAVGRLDLDIRGAEGAKVRTHAYITDLSTGDTQGTMNAGHGADLLPGKYRLEIQTIPPIIRESVVVKAGETTHVRVDTIGRLRMDATDAQGRPARVFAYVVDKRTENTLGVLNSGQDLDLVAGTYRLEIQTSPEQVRETVAVKAG